MQRTLISRRRNRRGDILSVVKDVYIRDDITCGIADCEICRLSQNAVSVDNQFLLGQKLFFPVSDVLLDQIGLFEGKKLGSVVVIKTVADLVKKSNQKSFQRVRKLFMDPLSQVLYFANENFSGTFVEPLHNKDAEFVEDCLASVYKCDDEEVIRLSSREVAATTVARLVSDERPDLKEFVSDFVFERGEVQEHLTLQDLEAREQQGTVLRGKIRMSRYNCREGYVSVHGNPDVIVRGRSQINRAIQGDVVGIELLPEEQWVSTSNRINESGVNDDKKENGAASPHSDKRATGRVVGIFERRWKQYCGTVDPPESLVESQSTDGLLETVHFVPVDRSVPRIRIKTRQLRSLLNMRVVVAIDSWNKDAMLPFGHYVKTLGPVGDKDTESKVILLENDVPFHTFSDAVMACLPSAPWSVSPNLLKARVDMRGSCIFSIDPPGCTDIDDALHYAAKPHGHFEVGVHIADVTEFVKPESAIDIEARSRGTTVYLVEKRINMLPKLLTEDICSLKENVDRLAFSCIIEFDPDTNVVKETFQRSVIRSRAALTYEDAQRRLDTGLPNDAVTDGIKGLIRTARILRQRRADNGALELASDAVRFELDSETCDPLSVEEYKMRETNSLVEEFMLMANIHVAKKIHQTYPSFALLRRHPEPLRHAFDELETKLKSLGVSLDMSSNKSLAASLERVRQTGNLTLDRNVRILVTRCMALAEYFSSGKRVVEDFSHYGLATPIYTHFTSPIRRYADVLVHRLLAAAVGTDPLPHDLADRDRLQQVADVLNRRHYAAQQAGRQSAQLYTALLVLKEPIEDEGVVLRVTQNGVAVTVPRLGIEGLCYVDDEEEAVLDVSKQELRLGPGKGILRLFDRTRVRVRVDENMKHHLRLRFEFAAGDGGKRKEGPVRASEKATPAKRKKLK